MGKKLSADAGSFDHVAERAASLAAALLDPIALDLFDTYRMVGVAERMQIHDSPVARRDWVIGQLEQLEAWARMKAGTPTERGVDDTTARSLPSVPPNREIREGDLGPRPT